MSMAAPSATAGGRQGTPQKSPPPQIDTRGIDAFEEGQKSHQQGRIAEAIALYDKAIALDEELWGAHFQKGVALLQLGKPKDAEVALRRAVEIEQDFAAAHAALADTLLALDRAADAVVEYRRAFEIDSALVQARPNFAVALWRTEAYEEADRELSLIERQNHATADTQTLHAEVLEKLNRPVDAARSFDLAIAADARHVDARVGRARLRRAAGDLDGAVADLTVANAVRPSAEVAAEIAELAVQSNDPERVLAALRDRVRADPTNRRNIGDLADALVRAGKADDAKKQADAIVALAPNDPSSHEAAGDVFAESSPLDAARYYVWAARLAPDNIEVRVKLGAVLVRARKFTEAIEHLALVVASQPDRREGHAGLATACYGASRYAEAAREFGWIAAREPQAAFVQFYLGASLDRIGSCLEALAAFERFLSLADSTADRARIDEVNLRIPGLKRQIDRGCGKASRK
jgi:tetratricopeptide (TPR) repeat protein